MKTGILKLVVFISVFISCNNEDDFFNPNAERIPPVFNVPTNFADPNLNQQAKDLYKRLINSTQKGIAFGQQQPFGTGNNFPVTNKLENDFFAVTGDYPAIAGFDLELIGLQPDTDSRAVFLLDEFIDQFTAAIKKAHENGSIITISWHHVNPREFIRPTDGSFNSVVKGFLEGGQFRELYIRRLARAARLLNNLVDANGNPIPVLFRPWHEMNGDFFFWGEGFRTTQEYIQLWQDTIQILSEDFNVHNLLYVYAPNFVGSRAEYLKNYPGDQFVDILGIDVYDFRNRQFLTTALRNLKIVENIGIEKNKLFALTETGLTNVVQHSWFTERLYKAIRASSISYVMIWRNDMTTFFHAPFLGHPAEQNFTEFLDKEEILLSKDIL